MRTGFRLLNQTSAPYRPVQVQARHFRSGVWGFVLGAIASGYLFVNIFNLEKRELEWSEELASLTKSVRKLETHVKTLEQQQQSSDKPRQDSSGSGSFYTVK